jgi:hypothetical protein
MGGGVRTALSAAAVLPGGVHLPASHSSYRAMVSVSTAVNSMFTAVGIAVISIIIFAVVPLERLA